MRSGRLYRPLGSNFATTVSLRALSLVRSSGWIRGSTDMPTSASRALLRARDGGIGPPAQYGRPMSAQAAPMPPTSGPKQRYESPRWARRYVPDPASELPPSSLLTRLPNVAKFDPSGQIKPLTRRGEAAEHKDRGSRWSPASAAPPSTGTICVRQTRSRACSPRCGIEP